MAHRKLGEILVQAGYLTPAQVDEILAAQARARARRFGELAIELKLVGSQPVKWALAQQQAGDQRVSRLVRKGVGAVAGLAVLWGAGKLAFNVVDPVHEGAAAPAFALENALTGERIALKDYKGKVLVLNFWATWCPPCQDELPELAALAKEEAAHGVKVLGVLIPPFDGPPLPTDMAYPSVRVGAAMRAAYGGIHAVPTTFVIDRKGRVAKRFVGGLTREVLQPEIDRLI